MSIDVNAIEQTVVVTAVGDEVNVNIIDQPVLVSVTDQIIEVEASGGTGPQGPAGAGVAAGGVTGQVLSKASNTNYDTVWVNAGAGTVYSVDASGSTGISVTGGPITGAGTLTITNTLPDKVVALSGAGTAVITGTYPNFTITTNDEFDGTVTSVNLTAGTGISVSGGPITGSGSISVTNTAPDQVVSLTGGGTTTISGTYPNFTITSTDSKVGTVTSVDMTVPTGLTISGNPITSAGTLALALASGYSIPTTASQANWNTAYNDSITSASVSGTSTKTLTLNQQDGGTIQASWSDLNTDAVTSVFGRIGAVVATEGDYTLTQLGDVTLTSPTNGQVLKYNGTTWVNNTDTDTGLTSVGLSMPSAFAVSNSPLTSNGTIAVTGAGTSAQYVRGDGQLANFPTNGGGGSSVNYYLNGSVSQGTFGGVTYYKMSKTPIIGAGTNFTRTNAQGNGYIASFITDAGDPALLNIPGGNWNLEFYFSASSGGGTPSFYAELYKVSSANVFTLVSSGSTNAEGITQGAVVDQYFTSIPVPQTALLATDRLAIRIFVTPSGRTITLHTENSNLCEVLTTFSTGLNALNGLTAQVQYFATGSSGTDFAISSATDTHTFNLPIASATNTGKLSNTDWTTFINKQNAITLTTFNASGSATFVSSVLNIPTYTLVGLGGEPAITPGASTQYFRGDKTFQTLDTSVVPENSNLYYTDTRARNAITLTTTGSSGASTYSGGTLNIPIYSLSGLGGVPTSRTLTINGTTYDLSADRSWTIPVHDAVTIGTANGLSLSTQVLSLGLSSSSANGALSSTDWSTFNGKQNAITLTTTGSSGAATLIGSTLNIPQYADQFVGTVTSVSALTIGTTGTDLSSSVANGTTTPVITLNVPTASATNRGALSSSDWTTFNGKQAALNGTGFVKISGTTISYDNSTYYLASNPSAYIALTALTASAPLSYNNTTGAFTIAQASGSVNGFLSSTDWTTFNNKQNALTNPVTGTGTTNYLPKFTGTSTIGNSNLINDASGNLGLGVTPSAWGSSIKAIDIVTGGAGIYGANSLAGFTANAFIDATSGTDTYKVTDFATKYLQIVGTHRWYNAPSGTAGNAISFTQAMTLTANGRLLLGTTTDAGYLLDVNGSARFSETSWITKNQNGVTSINLVNNDLNNAAGQALRFYFNTSTPLGGIIHQYNTTTSAYDLDFKVWSGFSPVTRLFLNGSTGAATFSSSVTAGSLLKVVEGGFKRYFEVTESTIKMYGGYDPSIKFGDYNTGIDKLATIGFEDDYFGRGALRFTVKGQANGSGLEAMRITSGGNLLVGTTTDAGYKLFVNGDIGAGAASQIYLTSGDLRFNSNAGFGIVSQNGSRLVTIQNGAFGVTGAATFSSSVTATVFYSSGATSPTSGLIIEPVGWNGAKHRLNVPTSGNTSMWSFNWNGSTRDYVSYGSSTIQVGDNLITFSNGTGNPSEVARFTGSNLLVGTTTDSGEKLQVSGSAKVSGKLIVNHSSTDYIAEFLNTSSANPYGVIIKDAASAANNYPLFHIVNNAASVEYFRVNSGTGTAVFSSTIQTGTPTGGTARPWKLGQYNATAPTATGYIEVEVNGVLYKLIAAT